MCGTIRIVLRNTNVDDANKEVRFTLEEAVLDGVNPNICIVLCVY